MKKLIVLSLSIFLVFLAAACDIIANTIPLEDPEVPGGDATEPEDQAETGETVVIIPAIQGNAVELTVGETLLVQIPTIPTEGFEWMVQDLDTKILLQDGKPLFMQQTGTDAAGGVVILKFKAVGTGETQLNLVYAKPTTGREPGLAKNSFGIKVTVRGVGGETVAVRPEIQGTSASLIVGDTLVVEIPTIPTEGFQWIVQKIDTSVLVQEGGASYIRDTRTADAAGGITYLNFTAVGPGETNLSLAYASEGSEDVPSLSKNTMGVHVSVRAAATGIVIVTQPLEGQTITMAPGDVLVVEISDAATQGYEWAVEGMDTSVLIEQGGSLAKTEIGGEAPDEIIYLRFLAAGKGSTPLNLIYRRAVSDNSGKASETKISYSMQVVVE